MYSQFSRLAEFIARTLALAGGFLLLGIIVLTCVSIIGRALVPLDIGIGSIRGIYDITEIGMAAAIFAFLPWCQFNRGHASVDLFEPAFPLKMNNSLNLLFDSAMFVVAAVGTWRLYLGMLDKLSYGETTLIAQIPVWQGFSASLVGAIGFVLVAAFCMIRSARILFGHGVEENAYV